jgi:hypothetical protein
MSPFAREMFDMLKETYRPPSHSELQRLMGEANEGLPALPLDESDIDGLCHSFSGRPVHLPTVSPKLVADELAKLERARSRENRGTPHEF